MPRRKYGDIETIISFTIPECRWFVNKIDRIRTIFCGSLFIMFCPSCDQELLSEDVKYFHLCGKGTFT